MVGDYESFKRKVLSLTGIDLGSYKEEQMKRRIDALIIRNNVNSYDSYCSFIANDKSKFDEFVNYLTINVSEFWRNPEQWKILEQKILPEFASKRSIKIWSAACSTGDEPYSLAMLLKKMNLSATITATDIDKQVLQMAGTGVYNEKSLKGLPREFLGKYFNKINKSTYQISDEIKRCVSFKQHNLLKDNYVSFCDLIVCRNVLIYFTEDAKSEIYTKFNKSLNRDGILFLGSTEQIINPQKYGFTPIASFFYKKNS